MTRFGMIHSCHFSIFKVLVLVSQFPLSVHSHHVKVKVDMALCFLDLILFAHEELKSYSTILPFVLYCHIFVKCEGRLFPSDQPSDSGMNC